nr:tetratricopeptide repeat protein [uncultured Lichenicoccus sp.]
MHAATRTSLAAGADPSAVDRSLDAIVTGHRLSGEGQMRLAAEHFRRAIALDPSLPMAHNNLGWVLEAQDDQDGALRCYRTALSLNPALTMCKANLAALLTKRGCFDEASGLFETMAFEKDVGAGTLSLGIEAALNAGRLPLAGILADRQARMRRGSRWHGRNDLIRSVPARLKPVPHLTAGKLRHDIEQLHYLRERDLLGPEFDALIARHEQILETFGSRDDRFSIELGGRERDMIGEVYGRIVFRPPAPRLPGRALSTQWDPAAVEAGFLSGSKGFVVIDDFLSDQALECIRNFCLQSTVWFKNSYRYGRLGAFLRDGFNCPLLLQVAEELQQALPQLIGRRHPLLQLWAFKNDHVQPETSCHADFAAVNVNFWITPDEANLDPATGGLVIHDLEAPADWAFDAYNKDGRRIEALLAERRPGVSVVPYRANRMILFRSDLFHKTAPLNFRPGYENRRINVTMLYGRRGAPMP